MPGIGAPTSLGFDESAFGLETDFVWSERSSVVA
jgi:hypothetical protein